MKTLNNILAWSFSFVTSSRLIDLLVTHRHPSHLERHRLDTVVTRIRLVATIFGVLTLLWIPLDIFTFDVATWPILAAVRVGVAFVFIALAALPRDEPGHGAALMLVFLMLANPLVLHTTAHVLLYGMPLAGPALINANLYAALPYVVIVGLSLFPLVAIETVVLALPIFALAIALPLYTQTFSLVAVFTQCWILGLLLGVAVLAGMIQTYYMDVLLKRANHDPLTGALTRRSGTEALEFTFRLANDKSAPMSVMFIDIDNFKSLNDTFGHDAGDDALRKAAEVLKLDCRDADAIIRWGGEEFVVLLGDTPLSGAEVVVHRIMDQWLGERPDGGPLTASIGLAERTADGCATWAELVELADQRMYEAKQTGKARYVARPALKATA